jgi:hypothetical protein
MGQYYKAVMLEDDKKTVKAFVNPAMGAKLMEHSWMLNDFVAIIENVILRKPTVLVWAGDYADGEIDESGNEMMIPHEDESYPLTLHSMCRYRDELAHGEPFLGLDKFDDDYTKSSMIRKYIVNHDTKEYVDKSKSPKDKNGWRVHPLPLLVADGNNRGGGDYRDGYPDFDKVGMWKRNLISMETRKSDIPKDYKEVIVKFCEECEE